MIDLPADRGTVMPARIADLGRAREKPMPGVRDTERKGYQGIAMGIITRYVCWRGHDASGALPRVDVLAGVITSGAWNPPASWPPLTEDEVLVYVPPQWIGDWETGHRLAPGYQHVWLAPRSSLHRLPSEPLHGPYRPATLPNIAIGPRPVSFPRRRRAASRRSPADAPSSDSSEARLV